MCVPNVAPSIRTGLYVRVRAGAKIHTAAARSDRRTECGVRLTLEARFCEPFSSFDLEAVCLHCSAYHAEVLDRRLRAGLPAPAPRTAPGH